MSANSTTVTDKTAADHSLNNSLNTDNTPAAAPAANIALPAASGGEGATAQSLRVVTIQSSQSASPIIGGSPVLVSTRNSSDSDSPMATPVGGASSRAKLPNATPFVENLAAHILPDAAGSSLHTGGPSGSSPTSGGLPPQHPKKATSPNTHNTGGGAATKNLAYQEATDQKNNPPAQVKSGGITPVQKSDSPTGTFASEAEATAFIHAVSSANAKGAADVRSSPSNPGPRRFSVAGEWVDVDPNPHADLDVTLHTDGSGGLHTGSESGGSSPVVVEKPAKGSPLSTGAASGSSANKATNASTAGSGGSSGGNGATLSATTSATASASTAKESIDKEKGSGNSTPEVMSGSPATVYVSVLNSGQLPEIAALPTARNLVHEVFRRGEGDNLHNVDVEPKASPSVAGVQDHSPRSDSSTAELRNIGNDASSEDDNSPRAKARGRSMLGGNNGPTMQGVPAAGGIFPTAHSAGPGLLSAATASASAAASNPNDTKFAKDFVKASNILHNEKDICETIDAINDFVKQTEQLRKVLAASKSTKEALETKLAAFQKELTALSVEKDILDKRTRIRLTEQTIHTISSNIALVEHQIETVKTNIRLYSESIPETHRNKIPNLEGSAGSVARQPLPPGDVKLSADRKFNFEAANASAGSATAAAAKEPNELRELNEMVLKLQKAEADRKAELDQMQKEKTALTAQQAAMQIELQKAKEEADKLANEKTILANEKTILANEKAVLTKERDSASHDKAHSEAALAEKTKQLSDLGTRLTGIQTAYDKTSSERDALHTQLQAKEQEIAQKTHQINHMQTQRAQEEASNDAKLKAAYTAGGGATEAGIIQRRTKIY